MYLNTQRGCLFLLMIGLSQVAQSQLPEPQIAGRVVRSDDGNPILGATIKLVPPSIHGMLNLQTAKTDIHGEYSFLDVKDGFYTIEVDAGGFVPETYKGDANPGGVFQHVTSSTRLRGVDFQLQREAVIRGVVTDAVGKPVGAGVAVGAGREERWESGTQRLVVASEAKTDVSGQFV